MNVVWRMKLWWFIVWSISGCAINSPVAIADTPFKPCDKHLTAPFSVLSSGWSRDVTQQRMYNREQAGLVADDLQHLRVAWSFVFKGSVRPRSLPAITEQAIFIGSEEGAVYGLDTNTGCGFWRFQAESEVRTAISVGKVLKADGREQWQIYFGDNNANIYAVDAIAGKLMWRTTVEEHPDAIITGSPVLYQGDLFVPVSSLEVLKAANPFYGCCSFRGSLVSLNAKDGRINWQSYTIPDAPMPTYRNAFFVHQQGASGAAIWSPPTIDEERQRIYIGTGQNYSSPATKTSNAIIAFDLKTGEIVWSQQTQPQDTWNASCVMPLLDVNCPDGNPVDFDFGAPPLLVKNTSGKAFLIAGQKSGWVYAMNPNAKGDIMWQVEVGLGGLLGGVHWGMAADAHYVYVPVSDVRIPGALLNSTKERPGLTKLALDTGKIMWHRSAIFNEEKDLAKGRNGLSAAVTGIEGAILAPGLDGVLRAYEQESGKVIWSFDSTVVTRGVNGLQGAGGTMDAGGVVVANGMLFFNSGYGGFLGAGGVDGNVFWVLKAD